jgi:uncharacterized glyoxalase superfamily protein PhnB
MSVTISGLTPLISVFDMIESARFYREVLGFEVVDASPEVVTPEGRFSHWMWLRRGGADLMLNTAYDSGERPPARDETRWAGHIDTCLYIGCEDVDAVFAELTAKGLQAPPPRVAPYGMTQLQISDPDGYAICFQGRVG